MPGVGGSPKTRVTSGHALSSNNEAARSASALAADTVASTQNSACADFAPT